MGHPMKAWALVRREVARLREKAALAALKQTPQNARRAK
jgi:hypothetical protein